MTLHIRKTTVAAQLLGAVVALAAVQAHAASDGTITFTGAIKTQTCEVDATGGQIAVVLPNVKAASLAAAGETAGRALIRIQLKNCAGTAGMVRAAFAGGATVDLKTGRLINTAAGGAENVQIQLLNKDETDIFVGNASTSKGEDLGTSDTGTLNYYAQYYATDAVTAGAVASNVTFSLDYQ